MDSVIAATNFVKLVLLEYASAISSGARVVGATKEQAAAASESVLEPTPGMVTIVTPPDDMKKAGELVDFEFCTPYVVKVDAKYKDCPNCGRENNFLDVLMTGVGYHGKDLVKKTLAGELGLVINRAHAQRCVCAGCGVELPAAATKFSAPLPPTAEQLDGSTYPHYRHPNYRHANYIFKIPRHVDTKEL